MVHGWENYYLMVGSSAAALIGLMFVVMTLTAGRDRAEVQRGKHLYTSPIVWNLGVIVLLSGATGGLALLGVAAGIRSAVGIVREPVAPGAAGFDMFWYGVAPAVAYLGLGVGAGGVFRGQGWAESAIAAAMMALLLISIHGEWDLVTFLAPEAKPPSDG